MSRAGPRGIRFLVPAAFGRRRVAAATCGSDGLAPRRLGGGAVGARAQHGRSGRRAGPLVLCVCSAEVKGRPAGEDSASGEGLPSPRAPALLAARHKRSEEGERSVRHDGDPRAVESVGQNRTLCLRSKPLTLPSEAAVAIDGLQDRSHPWRSPVEPSSRTLGK